MEILDLNNEMNQMADALNDAPVIFPTWLAGSVWLTFWSERMALMGKWQNTHVISAFILYHKEPPLRASTLFIIYILNI